MMIAMQGDQSASLSVYEQIDQLLEDGNVVDAIALFESLADDFERGIWTRHQAAIGRKIPAFLSTFMAKSAGTYLHNHLVAAGAFNLQHHTSTRWDLERAYFVPCRLRLFLRGGASNHTHMRAGPWNARVMHECGVTRFWIHSRDPRQAALSAYWHGLGYGQGADEMIVKQRIAEDARTKDVRVHASDDLLDPLDLPMDAQVRKQFVWRNSWITEWIEYLSILRFEVLLTTHEQMVADPAGFEQRILRFFDAPDHMRGAFGSNLPYDRFRKGATDEWRTQISRETQDWMTSQMSPNVSELLGWSL
jgi:hypothetical protein